MGSFLGSPYVIPSRTLTLPPLGLHFCAPKFLSNNMTFVKIAPNPCQLLSPGFAPMEPSFAPSLAIQNTVCKWRQAWRQESVFPRSNVNLFSINTPQAMMSSDWIVKTIIMSSFLSTRASQVALSIAGLPCANWLPHPLVSATHHSRTDWE